VLAEQLTLALLEEAPDRETAEIMVWAAWDQGIDADSIRDAWRIWKDKNRDARLRGEVA